MGITPLHADRLGDIEAPRGQDSDVLDIRLPQGERPAHELHPGQAGLEVTQKVQGALYPE